MTRRALLLLPLPLLASCTLDPAADYLGGFGEPLRGAALNAPRNLGDTSIYQGNPAGALMAAAHMEFLARRMTPADPRWGPGMSPTIQPKLEAGRDEFRAAIGLNPRLGGEAAEAALRAAAQRLRATVAAQAFTDRNVFTLGQEETLRRLNTLPRLPQVRLAAGAAAAEMDRMERRR
ncbi:hypothetical protein ACI6QG_01075 [Roseococcus sp. DSY-14]|uniref:hypothetical protein n=1 Tax=Roseococcus sp. DSY-14 TaxID=3369650 RepID=UPI00387AAC59